jgi:predicted alpha/beta hydrolase
VWLGNSRGNRYSTHKMSPIVLDFWNFSFNEMARYDLPAAFRYINRVTQRKIHYIGHSQGTLIMFIALTQKIKEVEDYLLSYNAFGPVAYLKHQKSALFNTLGNTPLLSVLMVTFLLLRKVI